MYCRVSSEECGDAICDSELTGSLEKQNYDFDRVARRYRAYSDYRANERYVRQRREQNEREQRERHRQHKEMYG